MLEKIIKFFSDATTPVEHRVNQYKYEQQQKRKKQLKK